MQSENYRNNLIEALKNLAEVNQSIFNSLIDVSMQGELEEWNASVPIGEEHQFDFEIFRNSNDTNIQILVSVIENIDSAYEKIKNINNITLE